MSNFTESRASRTISTIKRLFAEIDYAQRRSVELRTGVPMVRRAPRTAKSAAELESLFRV